MNPVLIPQPFANSGIKSQINNTRQQGQAPQDATWSEGFPAITMEHHTQGGLPPNGPDVNAVLNALSEHIFYIQKGGRYVFDETFAQAIGGYPKGAVLQSKNGDREFLSLINNNKTDPDSLNSAGWLAYAGTEIKVVDKSPSTLLTNAPVIYDLQHDIQKRWRIIGTFEGYASNQLGLVQPGTTLTAREYEVEAVGGIVNKSNYPALWAFAQAQSLVKTTHKAGEFSFINVDSTRFRLPDLRNQFIRFTGTDVDNANARALGSYQQDAMQKITGRVGTVVKTGSSGVFKATLDTISVAFGDAQSHTLAKVDLDSSLTARTSTETRSCNTALAPRIIAF
ncbi:hypothetical protein AAEX37_01943 [Oligella sp. MSHR50489EDL]|uniref:hypothetical protein n=1 Tax=Oligella sp. MSHR50489EDL TaxID=3139409 RepID=UPI003D8153B5